MRGKGKEIMADVQRSFSKGQNIRPAGLVQRSMLALVEPQHAVGASPVATEQQTRMPNTRNGGHATCRKEKTCTSTTFD